jgi:hypothetical protein
VLAYWWSGVLVGMSRFKRMSMWVVSIQCQDKYIKGEEALMQTQEPVLDKAQSELKALSSEMDPAEIRLIR